MTAPVAASGAVTAAQNAFVVGQAANTIKEGAENLAIQKNLTDAAQAAQTQTSLAKFPGMVQFS